MPYKKSSLYSFCIFGEEAPTINAASAFVGNEHRNWEHSLSSVTRVFPLAYNY